MSKPRAVRAHVFWIAALLALAGCGTERASLRENMDSAETAGRQAENALDEADKRMDRLDVEGAESALSDAREKLADPNITKYPEHSLLKDRLASGRTRLETVRAELAKRELEKAVLAARQTLEAASARLDAALESLKKPSATKATVGEVEEAEKDLAEKIGDAREVETKDAELGAYADTLRKQLAKAREEVGRVAKVMIFRSGPGAARVEATRLGAEMKEVTDPEDVAELRGKIIDRLQLCVVDGKELLVRTPELGKTKIELEGRGVESIDAVVTSCQKELDALVKKAKPKPVKKAKPKIKKKKKKR